MKNVKLILLTITAMLFLGIEDVRAQEKSTVIITTVTVGKNITLQTIDNQDNTTSEQFKFSKDKPEQAILKIEMDKWIKQGYEIKQSYGYASTITVGTIRYETVILFKEE